MHRFIRRLIVGTRARLGAAAIVSLLVASIFQPAALAADAAAEVDQADVMQGVSINIFKIDDRNAKLTLRGVAGAIEKLQTYGDSDERTFRYSIVMHAGNDVELHGSFYYKKTEKKPYLNMSSFLKCNYNTYDSRNFYFSEDCINWTVNLPRWVTKSFDFSEVTSVDVTFRNAVRSKCTVKKTIDAPVSSTILETSMHSGGKLKVVPVNGETLRVYIGDPDLLTGYPNSPSGKGTKAPVWYVKAVINSYLWVEMQIDGRNATSLNDMEITAGEFHLLKSSSNKYHAKTFEVDTASYRVENNQLVLELIAPTQAFHYLKWIQIDMNNGADSNRYVIAH